MRQQVRQQPHSGCAGCGGPCNKSQVDSGSAAAVPMAAASRPPRRLARTPLSAAAVARRDVFGDSSDSDASGVHAASLSCVPAESHQTSMHAGLPATQRGADITAAGGGGCVGRASGGACCGGTVFGGPQRTAAGAGSGGVRVPAVFKTRRGQEVRTSMCIDGARSVQQVVDALVKLGQKHVDTGMTAENVKLHFVVAGAKPQRMTRQTMLQDVQRAAAFIMTPMSAPK
eukprot:463892-Pleurochrysis_carterae.AAC.1